MIDTVFHRCMRWLVSLGVEPEDAHQHMINSILYWYADLPVFPHDWFKI